MLEVEFGIFLRLYVYVQLLLETIERKVKCRPVLVFLAGVADKGRKRQRREAAKFQGERCGVGRNRKSVLRFLLENVQVDTRILSRQKNTRKVKIS